MGMCCSKFYSYNIGQFPNLWYLYHVCDIWKVNKLQLQITITVPKGLHGL
jgi:hypothetical protein